MKLVGTLNNTNLKNIFAYIADQGLTGSFSISDGISEKLLFIQPTQIKLFSIGERKRIMLGEVLLLMAALTEEQFEQALFIQKNTGMKIGEILVEENIIEKSVLDSALQNVLFEEVYDLLFWEGANFYFSEQTDESVFERGDLRHIEIDTDMKRFLSEISKKIDEIDVLKKWVPNPGIVYALKRNIKQEDCLAKYPGYSSKLVLGLLDGENDVAEVCVKSRISSYEVYRVLSLFLSDGFIQEATKDNFLVKGDQALADKDGKKALSLLKHYEEKGGARNDILDKLALAHEIEGQTQEASLCYAEAGEIMFNFGDFNKAFKHFEKAVELWPDNIDIIVHYGELLKQRDKIVEWTTQFEHAARLAEEQDNTELSIKLYRDVLERAKRSPNSKRHLARLMKGRLSLDDQQTSILCPVCETKNGRENEECDSCGSELFHSCFSCGRSIPVSDTVCGECGGDPFKSVESSASVSETAFGLEEGAEATQFWDKKLDTYLEQSRESSSHLNFEEAKTSLKTAMILNPDSEVIKKELEFVDRMSAQTEIAEYIDLGMAAYYSNNPIPAFKAFKKAMTLADSNHPRYSDIVSFFTETKASAGKKNLIYGIIAGILIIVFLSIYIPMELGRRKRNQVREGIQVILSSNAQRDPEVYRENFGKLDNFADAYKGHEELFKKIVNAREKLLSDYYQDASDKFKQSISLGEKGKFKDAITGLELIKKDYHDITAEAVAEMGEIDGKIEHFREQIRLREDFKERQKRTLENFDELKNLLKEGKYAQTEIKIKTIDGFLSMGGKVFSDKEIEEYTGIKKQIKDFIAEFDKDKDHISNCINDGRFPEAGRVIREARSRYKGTDLVLKIESSSKRLVKTETKVNADFNKAIALRKGGELQSSLTILAEIVASYPKYPRIMLVKQIEEEINTYISDGRKLLGLVKKAIDNKDVKRAYELTNAGISRYSDLEEIKALNIPVLLETDPGSVTVKDVDGQTIGTSPVMVYIKPEGKRIFFFTRKGFKKQQLEIDTSSWKKKIILEKTIIWEPVKLSKRVSVSAIFADKKVIIPAESTLYAFDPASGKIAWDRTLYPVKKIIPTFEGGKRGEKYVGKNDFWNIGEVPRLNAGDITVAGKDGKIYFIDPAGGFIKKKLPEGKKDFLSITSNLIVENVSYMMDEKIAFFASLDMNLYAVSVENAKPKWKKPFKQKLSSLFLTEKGVWAGTAAGEIIMCEITSGMNLFSKRLGKGKIYDFSEIKGNIFACSESGELLLFKPDGQDIWSGSVEDSVPAASLVTAEMILVPGRSSLVNAVDPLKGTVLWRAEMKGNANCTPAVSGNEVFIGNRNNQILCLNAADGAVKWNYKTDGNVVCVLSAGGHLIVITENGTVYTFDMTV